MVDTPRKTFPELQALPAPVVDSDVLAVYRSPGPAKRTTASVLATYFSTVIGTSFTRTLLATTSNSTFLAALGQIASTALGYLATWTGAVNRTVNSRLGDIVSVKDFGAVGDGVTDDTAAFNLAIAYANAKGGTDRTNVVGTTIFIPQGRYPIGQLDAIAVSDVQFSGLGQLGGTVLLHSYNGATFRWLGPVGDTIVGGGLTNVRHEYLGTPGASACIVEVARANALDFSNWHVFNIACALRLGTASNATAAGIIANNWSGGVRNMDAPVIDLQYGAGFEAVGHYLFVSGVGNPPFSNGTFTSGSAVVTGLGSTTGFFAGQGITSTSGRVPALTTVLSVDSATQITMSANALSSGSAMLSGAMTTVAGRAYIRGTAGFWDTCQLSNALLERFDQGISLVADVTGKVYQHFCLSNVTMDYIRRHCIYAETNASGVITSISSDNICWFMNWENAAIQLVQVAGTMDDFSIQGKVPITGGEAVSYNVPSAKRNTFTVYAGAVNRANIASAALNFVAGSKGFSVIGCMGNDDLTGLGLPFFADWGVQIGADCDEYVVTGNRMNGNSGGSFFNTNITHSAGSTLRQISANGRPNYAVQLSSAPYVLPASGSPFTNTNGWAMEVIISGGTVTQIAKNGVNTGLTSGTFIVGPGETLTPTYSSAPTALFFGLN